MKVALVHDYIKEYGGAERVLEALHEMYPDAPVFTSVFLPEFLGPHRERFKDWDIRTSWLKYIPYKHKLISPFRLLSPLVFKQFNLAKYDVVIISATGAYFPNMVKTKKKSPQPPLIKGAKKKIPLFIKEGLGEISSTIHICYCHTPPRYLYGYATARDWKKHKIFAILGAVANHFLRLVDFSASKNVDFYIANSQEVASRIKKFYRREATVIYPPVEITNSKLQIPNKSQNSNIKIQKDTSYYLTGGRLARAKHVDLIVQACAELGVALKIFGRGFAGYEEEIKSSANARASADKQNSKVEFLGEVSDEEKYQLMRNAKAFIFAGEDEDFGIVPVEAMSAGTPVIAYKSGGLKETILQGRTGLFFEELTVASLKSAIKQFETLRPAQGKKMSEDCRKQAEKFSRERFIKEITLFVEKHVNK